VTDTAPTGPIIDAATGAADTRAFPFRGDLSPGTKRAAQAFVRFAKERGTTEVILYEEMAVACGGDVRKHRHWCTTAIRVLNRPDYDMRLRGFVAPEDRPRPMWFKTIRSLGWKLATDAERAEAVGQHITRARHTASRGAHIATPIQDDAATRDTLLSQLAGVGVVTSKDATCALRRAVLGLDTETKEYRGKLTGPEAVEALFGRLLPMKQRP
jgi:hypothetical protein